MIHKGKEKKKNTLIYSRTRNKYSTKWRQHRIKNILLLSRGLNIDSSASRSTAKPSTCVSICVQFPLPSLLTVQSFVFFQNVCFANKLKQVWHQQGRGVLDTIGPSTTFEPCCNYSRRLAPNNTSSNELTSRRTTISCRALILSKGSKEKKKKKTSMTTNVLYMQCNAPCVRNPWSMPLQPSKVSKSALKFERSKIPCRDAESCNSIQGSICIVPVCQTARLRKQVIVLCVCFDSRNLVSP